MDVGYSDERRYMDELPTAPVRPWALPWRSGRAEPFTMDPLSLFHGSVGVAVPAVQLLSAAALKRL